MVADASALGVAFMVFAGVVVSATATYLVARQAKSGKVDTTEAAKLWEESTAMRGELRNQVAALQIELKRVELEAAAEVAALRVEHQAKLVAQQLGYDAQVAVLNGTILDLRARIAKLEATSDAT